MLTMPNFGQISKLFGLKFILLLCYIKYNSKGASSFHNIAAEDKCHDALSEWPTERPCCLLEIEATQVSLYNEEA